MPGPPVAFLLSPAPNIRAYDRASGSYGPYQPPLHGSRRASSVDGLSRGDMASSAHQNGVSGGRDSQDPLIASLNSLVTQLTLNNQKATAQYEDPGSILAKVDPGARSIFVKWQKEFKALSDAYVTHIRF